MEKQKDPEVHLETYPAVGQGHNQTGYPEMDSHETWTIQVQMQQCFGDTQLKAL